MTDDTMPAALAEDAAPEAQAPAPEQDPFVARMQRVAAGDEPPANATIAYLLEQYRTAHARLVECQKEASERQNEAVALQGRIAGLEQDLRHLDAVAQQVA